MLGLGLASISLLIQASPPDDLVPVMASVLFVDVLMSLFATTVLLTTGGASRRLLLTGRILVWLAFLGFASVAVMGVVSMR